jgi:acetoin utilization deacetylase AcuC-like enzyme
MSFEKIFDTMKKNLGLYIYPETLLQLRRLKPIKALADFIDLRNNIHQESTIPLNRVDIGEFRSVHTQTYLDALIRLSRGEKPEINPALSMECLDCHDFLPGHEYGLGGIYAAIDLMKKGVLDRAWCFALPGHHAHPELGHGYCMLNTQAAGARYAQQNGFKNILIIDWDFHHGDGTQTIFENDPSVYQISIHNAVDLYMNKMMMTNRGLTTYGSRVGHCNIPLLNRILGDEFYFHFMGDEFSGELYNAGNCLEAYRSALENLPFSPDMIFIFDGHDSHIDDLGREITDWKDDDFKFLAQTALDAAGKFGCPVISSPAGGYNTTTLRRLTGLHINILREYEK